MEFDTIPLWCLDCQVEHQCSYCHAALPCTRSLDFSICDNCFTVEVLEEAGVLEVDAYRMMRKKCSEMRSRIDELSLQNAELRSRQWQLEFLRTWDPSVLNTPFADVVLMNSDGVTINAHKFVLMSKSSVFKAMFKNDMIEAKKGIVKLDDMVPGAMVPFVQFFYTAQVEDDDMEKYSDALFIAAQKYDVCPLSTLCEEFLASSVCVENAITLYELAAQYNVRLLKQAALQTILTNIKQVQMQQSYKILVGKDPKLVIKIYEAFVKRLPGKRFLDLDIPDAEWID